MKEEVYVIADITTHIKKYVSAILALIKYEYKEKILKILYKMEYNPDSRFRFTRPSSRISEPYKNLNDSQKKITVRKLRSEIEKLSSV
jgi:hypothetical protein